MYYFNIKHVVKKIITSVSSTFVVELLNFQVKFILTYAVKLVNNKLNLSQI